MTSGNRGSSTLTLKKNLENENDKRWRTKGGSHRCAIPLPDVCPDCGGTGCIVVGISDNGEESTIMCVTCEGTGEVYR